MLHRLHRRLHWIACAAAFVGLLAMASGAVAQGVSPRSAQPFLSELRLGLMLHDAGLLGVREEEGADVNLELLFGSPRFLAPLLSPRPHLGVTVSTAGETSQAYAGLTWDLDLTGEMFLEASFGAALHDGHTGRIDETHEKSLGCSLLFRGAAAIGRRFGDENRHSLSLMFDHISNGGLCDENQGLDTFGLRYGYRF